MVDRELAGLAVVSVVPQRIGSATGRPRVNYWHATTSQEVPEPRHDICGILKTARNAVDENVDLFLGGKCEALGHQGPESGFSGPSSAHPFRSLHPLAVMLDFARGHRRKPSHLARSARAHRQV